MDISFGELFEDMNELAHTFFSHKIKYFTYYSQTEPVFPIFTVPVFHRLL